MELQTSYIRNSDITDENNAYQNLESQKNSDENQEIYYKTESNNDYVPTRNIGHQFQEQSEEFLLTHMDDENFKFTNTTQSQQHNSSGMNQGNMHLEEYDGEHRGSQESINGYPKTQLTTEIDREEINPETMLIQSSGIVDELDQDQYYDEEEEE